VTIKIYVPIDVAAIACGAEDVVLAIQTEALKRGLPVQIIRNGSRGLLWLEPMVEVETPKGRIAYGPVEPTDVAALFDDGFHEGKGKHKLHIGLIDEHPYLKNQQRLTFARCGITDPRSLDAYQALGGYKGLEKAIALGPKDTVEEVFNSGLRGRGGAGFPTGIKWRTVAAAPGTEKYVVINADEGDSGTFSDRMIMEGDPFVLIEGMTICGLAVGATYGYVYVRSEYPHAIKALNDCIAIARKAGLLGKKVMGSSYDFDMEVRMGAGAYVCGEETSLLESLEGKRGLVRAKPPLPALVGAFGKPTVINNVMSMASVPIILSEGGKYYADFGMGRSRGTMPVQLAGNLKYGGLVEIAFGCTLGSLVYDYGGGTVSGRPERAVQVGGPLGAYVPTHQWETLFDYEEFAKIGAGVGHGGIVLFDDTVDMMKMARFAMEFCAVESCGKCTPCRIGSTRGMETFDKIAAGIDVEKNLALIADLSETMRLGSLCALGGMTPFPVDSAIKHFPEDFRRAQKLQAAE
jgi:formate dehydrogenase iron-sulfur subunit